MNEEEITQLQETLADDAREKIDPKDGDALAVLGESEGWRILMRRANKVIASLLEQVDVSDLSSDTNLLLIGANSIANGKAIRVLRSFINEVESEKNARRAILRRQEESKQGA